VSEPAPMMPQGRWVMPVPDARVLPDTADPAELAASRETIHLAFVAALQYLPARQRAVLILREVLGWSAAEVAVLLDTTVASVTSALQRARSTMAVRDPAVAPSRLDDNAEQELLADYVDAFERYDVARLTALLHNDATQSMTPYPLWIQGPGAIGRWMLGPGIECRSSRLLPTAANGRPALAQYRPDGSGGHLPFAVHVLGIDGNLVREIHTFVVPELFTAFGLPSALAAADPAPIGR
jgi:RNA polymerase sigma-70 factor, ECF subfamily